MLSQTLSRLNEDATNEKQTMGVYKMSEVWGRDSGQGNTLEIASLHKNFNARIKWHFQWKVLHTRSRGEF